MAAPGRARRARRPASRRALRRAGAAGALARALVGHPALPLLDEPLSALDARTRLVVRAELRRHLGEFDGSTVLVTHDPVDAMALADRVVVVEDGRAVQTGTPVDVSPAATHRLRRPAGRPLPAAGTGRGVAGWTAGAWRSPTTCTARCSPPSAPSPWRLPGPPRGQPPQRLAGPPGRRDPHGATVRCELAGEVPLVADVTATSFAELGLAPGAPGGRR